MFSALVAVCVGRSGFARDILRQWPAVASWDKSETLPVCPAAAPQANSSRARNIFAAARQPWLPCALSCVADDK